MARAYTLGTAALALGVTPKWLDNTLSHFTVVGVRQERQGIARHLTIDALLILSVVIVLVDQLQVPLRRAIEISDQLVQNQGKFPLSGAIEFAVDLATLRARLLEHLEHAVEIAPVPRRGRPPKNTTGRLD